jgi:hypothetical protein
MPSHHSIHRWLTARETDRLFQQSFPGRFSLEPGSSITFGEKQTPLLNSGSTTVNLNNSLVDKFSMYLQNRCTVFVRMTMIYQGNIFL